MRRGKFYRQETAGQENICPAAEHILRIIKTVTFDSLLEFGCGYGKLLKPLSSQCANRKLVGVDISSTMLQEAKNYLADTNIELHKTDGVTLPFADKSFDITLTAHVLIHNPPDKISEIIKEIKRVTKKSSIHMESTVKMEDAEDYYCHDYEHLFVVNGGKPKLVAEFGKQGKIYIVNWP